MNIRDFYKFELVGGPFDGRSIKCPDWNPDQDKVKHINDSVYVLEFRPREIDGDKYFTADVFEKDEKLVVKPYKPIEEEKEEGEEWKESKNIAIFQEEVYKYVGRIPTEERNLMTLKK